MFFVIPRSAATRNLPQFRRDSSDHKPADDFRLPYAPWQDLGVEVYGPVLHDMAQNFRESWLQMRMKGPDLAGATVDRLSKELMAALPWSTPADEEARAEAEERLRQKCEAYYEEQLPGRNLADLTNEVYPEHLIGAALAAGLGKDAKVKDRKILNRYDVTSYKSLIKDGSLELSPPEEWNYRLAPQCLEACRFLTTLSMIFYGLMTKAFVGDGMLRSANTWNLSIPDADDLKLPQDAAVKHTAQFFRTFPLLGMPKEVSIFQAYLNAIRKVQDGQLIYIENQYFRDEYITGELILRHEQGINFNLIIVANPLTDQNEKFLAGENMPAEGPMKVCLERLKEAGINHRVCWLRVKEREVPEYAEPRTMSRLGYLVGLLGKADLFGDARWSQRFDVAMKYRNHLLDECYPWLEMRDEREGLSVADRFDDAYNARIRQAAEDAKAIREALGKPTADRDARIKQAVEDYKAIREALEKMVPRLRSWEKLKNALNDMSVALADSAQEIALKALDEALKMLVAQVNVAGDQTKWKLLRLRWEQTWDRWNYNINDFFNYPHLIPKPFIEQDRYYQRLQQELARYHKDGKSADKKKSLFGSLTGHIYVHTKLMIVDGNYAIIGSANINERSMWHDTEVALGFRASEGGSVPREMVRTLCQAHFGMDPPEGKEEFKEFADKLNGNDDIYNKGKPTAALEMHALTLVMRDKATAGSYSAS